MTEKTELTESEQFTQNIKKNQKDWQFLINSLNKTIDKKSKALIKTGDDLQQLLLKDFISTGSISLDVNASGGLLRGRIYEFFGQEASGKTTLVLVGLKNFLKTDPRSVVFIDAEHSLNISHVTDLDIDPSRFILIKPDTGEEAMVLAETVIKSGLASAVALDSVASLVPKDEQDKGLDGNTMGKLGALMSKALKSFSAKCEESDTAFLMINQVRSSLNPYGPSEVVPGGWASKFYCTGRFKVKKVGYISDSDKNIIGQEIEVTVEKNKLGPAKKTCLVRFLYGQSEFDIKEEVASLITQIPSGLKVAGSWIKIQTNDPKEPLKTLCQGKSSLAELFDINPLFFNDSIKKILEYYKVPPNVRHEFKLEPFPLSEIKLSSSEVPESTPD